MIDDQPKAPEIYEVHWYDANGHRLEQELTHFPTAADVPKGAVRMDVALPWPGGIDAQNL